MAPLNDVGHVNINTGKPCPVESCRHLNLTIHTLLSKHGHFWPTAVDKRCRNIFSRIKCQLGKEPAVFPVGNGIKRLSGTLRIITQQLHAETGFAPHLLEFEQILINDPSLLTATDNALILIQFANNMADMSKAFGSQMCQYFFTIPPAHLNHCAQLFSKQDPQLIIIQCIKMQRNAHPACESHFRYGRKQPPIGTIMVSKQEPFGIQPLNSMKERPEQSRIIQIGRLFTRPAINLGQS